MSGNSGPQKLAVRYEKLWRLRKNFRNLRTFALTHQSAESPQKSPEFPQPAESPHLMSGVSAGLSVSTYDLTEKAITFYSGLRIR